MQQGGMRNDNDEALQGLRPVLKPAQERVLATLAERGAEDFTRSTYEEIAHVSRSQAAYDLADLVKLGLVDRLGAGRATRYRVAQEGDGRRRKWTPARIRDELERFCGERGRWPRAAEFRDAGYGSLYLAASRYGGIEHWAAELGFSEASSGARASRRDSTLHALPRTGLVAAVLAGLILLGFLLIARLVPAGTRSADAPAPAALRERVDAAPGSVSRARLAATPAAPAPVALVLRGTEDGSWIVARRGSAAGTLLWRGTLEGGELLRLRGGSIWLRLGTAANVLPRVNGRRVALAERTAALLVNAKGVRVLDTAPAPAPREAPSSSTQPVSSSSVAPASGSGGASTDDTPAAPSGGDGPAPDAPPAGGSGPAPDPPPGQ
jgi:hypothetical protein